MDKTAQGSKDQASQDPINLDQEPKQLRRDFLKRFGRHAATIPVATLAVMSSKSSKAIDSGNEGGD